jgi:ABC-2 type transport system permease protein
VTALVRSELLKVRTTRARFAYPLVILALAGLGAAGAVGSGADRDRSSADFQAELFEIAALVAPLLALLLGITIVTSEFRHGTITPTFLVAPVRERVLTAKALVATVAGAVFALFSFVVIAAVAIPWLTVIDEELRFADGEVVRYALQVVLAAAVWGLLGAAVGSAVHSQIAGLVGALVWLLIAENIVIALLALVDWERAGEYFPGKAIADLAARGGGELGVWTALAVSLGYVVAIGAFGVARTRRRDIT